MSILYRLLLVLMTLRLLLPPGVCICKLHSPAARLLASLFNSKRPIPVEEDDDDHHADGCPASKVQPGLGLKPTPLPMPVLTAEIVPIADLFSPPSVHDRHIVSSSVPPDIPPPFDHAPLLI